MKEKRKKYIHIKSKINARNKTILMYHGWGSTIESQVVIGEKLANLGFDIVIPEIIYHDTRQPLKEPFEKTSMQNYFWKTIFHSIDEVNEYLKCLNLTKKKYNPIW